MAYRMGDPMIRVESPFEALDVHLHQWEWTDTAPALAAARLYCSAYRASGNAPIPAAQFASYIHGVLNESMTYYVVDEVLGAVREAAESLPGAALQPSDLPSPSGLVVFPEPIPYRNFEPEIDGYLDEPIPVRAIGWSTGPIGVLDTEAGVYRANADDADYEVTTGVVLWVWGDLPAMVDLGWLNWDRAVRGAPPPMLLVDHTGWAFGHEWQEVPLGDEEYGTGLCAPHVADVRRLMLTLWTFMAQQISPPVRQRPPRPALRRWEASGMNVPEDGSVVVVRLRRYRTDHGDTDEVEGPDWSHRWLVRGHWRQIADRKTGLRRAVWVHPYVKGPEDRPLVLKDKLGVIAR